MREPVIAFIGLGANLGDPQANLTWAIDQISALPKVLDSQGSGVYRSAPIDSCGPDYFNAVLMISTTYSAPDLMVVLQKIEQLAGRERPYRNAPRTLDLDLLLYGSAQINSLHLQVPHPRLTDRAFVLLPLAELAPDRVTVDQLARVREQVCERVEVP